MKNALACSLCNNESIVELNNDGKCVAFCRYHADQFSEFWNPGRKIRLLNRLRSFWLKLHGRTA